MSQPSVLALVDEYAAGLEGPTQVLGFYEDLMWDATRWGVATSVQLVPTSRGTSEYTMPATEGKRYMLFYDDIQLSLVSLQDLEAVTPDWRDVQGKPDAYTVSDEDLHEVQVYPAPGVNASSFVFLFGSPMGLDFPERAIGVVIGEHRDDLPSWMDVPLALAVLGREYARESDHTDVDLAMACQSLSGQLLAMVLA